MTLLRDQPPKDRLPREAACGSADDVGRALQELAWLRSRKKTAEASTAQAIRLLKERTLKTLQTEIDGETVSFADREEALLAAVEVYAEEHRGELLAETGLKSREFAFGKLSWRQQPARLQYAAEENGEQATLAFIEAAVPRESKLVQLLARYLAKFSFAGFKLDELLTIKLTFNFAAIRACWTAGKLNSSQIDQLGLKVSGSDDKLSIDVGEWTVIQETSEAA